MNRRKHRAASILALRAETDAAMRNKTSPEITPELSRNFLLGVRRLSRYLDSPRGQRFAEHAARMSGQAAIRTREIEAARAAEATEQAKRDERNRKRRARRAASKPADSA
jgi:hypothetical protein